MGRKAREVAPALTEAAKVANDLVKEVEKATAGGTAPDTILTTPETVEAAVGAMTNPDDEDEVAYARQLLAKTRPPRAETGREAEAIDALPDSDEDDIVPGPAYDPKTLVKAEYDERLAKYRRRVGKVEMHNAKAQIRAKFAVIPEAYDPLIFEVIKSKGYVICVGKPATPDLGFSLHTSRPEGSTIIDAGTSREPGTRPTRAAFVAPDGFPDVKGEGIPIQYVSFVQPVSLDEGSSSANAERHLSAEQKTRGNELVRMWQRGADLVILVWNQRDGGRFILVPIANTVKRHPTKGWNDAEMERLGAEQPSGVAAKARAAG